MQTNLLPQAAVTALAALRLQVGDLQRARDFYIRAWGLEGVRESAESVSLRTRSAAHHDLEIVAGDSARLLGVEFEVRDRSDLNRLCESAEAWGCRLLSGPPTLGNVQGGGYAATIEAPEGLQVGLHCGREPTIPSASDASTPKCLTHVVLNTGMLERQLQFFTQVLGFRVSDTTARMTFIRCGTDHHSMALAVGDSMSLNHAAFEMDDLDGLMYGCGRMIDNGYPIEWGPGRHGPGNNIFCYFIDPDGFAVEYTTGMDQIDEASHVAQDAAYWTAFPRRPCRWGVARKPSEKITLAFSGKGLGQ